SISHSVIEAEDGIRGLHVTGVQTCALPIWFLGYTQNGLTYDFAVGQDGWNQWWPDHIIYSIYPGWGRVDMRIINMMDPSTTAHWPDNVNTFPASSSEDDRLATDFEYLASQAFAPDRGYYHFSTYRHSRYHDILTSGYVTDLYEMLKAENDLYMAEAHLYLGNLTEDRKSTRLNSSHVKL